MFARSCVSVLVALSGAALADPVDQYPVKPVRVIIPFPAGAAADGVMRPVARKLTDYWGKPVIIDNRSGIPGIQVAAAAAPDGYTLLAGAGSSLVTVPLMLRNKEYDPQRDFAAISRLVTISPILTAHPSVPVKNVKELIALAKRQPGVLNFSSSGTGSPGHLSMELFMSMTGISMVHVPYKGGAPSVTDLIAGQVQLGFNAIPSVLPHVNSGKLRALAVASMERAQAMPHLPTIHESAVPGFDYDIWYGLFAPARVPPAIVEKISVQVRKALGDAEVVRLILAQGAEPAATTPQALTSFIKSDTARWSRIITERGLKMN